MSPFLRSFAKAFPVASFTSIGFFSGTLSVQGQAFVWDGSESNNWATGANWVGNNVPNGTGIRISVGTTGVPIDWAHRLVYSEAQGTTSFAGDSSSRSLFIGNGSSTAVGNMEITGGIFKSTSSGSDGMANGGGNGTLVLNGGAYEKITGSGAASTFHLNYGVGTSVLEINSGGAFRVTTLNFQGDGGSSSATTGEIRLNSGGTLSVGAFTKTDGITGTAISTQNVYLNGGTVESRLNDMTWADRVGVTWTLQNKSTFNIGHGVTFGEALGGAGGFDKTGVGNFTLTGANTYAGVTTVKNGALTLDHNTALGASGSGNGTVVEAGGRLILADNVTVTGETLSIAGNGGNNFGGLQAAANATGTWDGAINVTAGDTRIGAQTKGHLIIKGNISSNSHALVIRSEGGAATSLSDFNSTVVTLEGTYTSTGLNLYQGVVKLGASDRISDSVLVSMGTGSNALSQRLDLNGYNEKIAGLIVSGTPGAGSVNEVTNSSDTLSTLALDSGTNRIFSGIITGNLAIRKEGSNIVTFSGANTYTGDTLVSAGTLQLGSVNAVAGSTVDTSGAGSYAFNVSGANTYAFGGLKGSGNLAIGANSLNVGGNNASTTFSGVLSGTGGLAKAGAGTLTLSGANTYGAATIISEGNLNVTGSVASAVTVGTGTTLGGTGTVGGATVVQSGGILSVGNGGIGELTFSSTLQFDSGSIFKWEIGAGPSDPGDGSLNEGSYDQLIANGAVTGTGIFQISSADAFATEFWDTDKSWDNIFSGTGSFDLSALFPTFSGTLVDGSGHVSGQGTFSFVGGTTLQWKAEAIPEPGNALAGLLIAAGLFRRGRSRGKKKA